MLNSGKNLFLENLRVFVAIDLESLAAHLCVFKSRQGLGIVSWEETSCNPEVTVTVILGHKVYRNVSFTTDSEIVWN